MSVPMIPPFITLGKAWCRGCGRPFGDHVARDFRVGEAADAQPIGVGRTAAEADGVRTELLLQAQVFGIARRIVKMIAHEAIVGAVGMGVSRIPRMDRDLDDHVRQLVDEMENEIGEDGFAVAQASIAGDGQSPDGHVKSEHDVVEQAVREILIETGEDP